MEGTHGTLSFRVAAGITVIVSIGLVSASLPWGCGAAFCSNSSAGFFFLLFGGTEGLEDE